jgi:hydroxylamine dehydrogenase
MEGAGHLVKTGEKAYIYPNFPNATGSTQRPEKIFGPQQ